MTELLPPPGMSIDATAGAIHTAFGAEDGGEQELDRTFLDTFDGLLHGDGLTLVHEAGQFVLSDREDGGELAAAPGPVPGGPLQPAELPDGQLREHLLDVCELRALLPLAHVHSRTRTFSVLDEERKTVVRLALEEAAVVEGAPLPARLRLIGLRGYGAELDAVRARLEGELGFVAAAQPLVDEAVRAVGGVPGGISSKIEVPLALGMRADEAAAAVLRRLLEVIEANLDGALAELDAEFLHDFRVSVRRSRSVQRQLKSVFPPSRLEQARSEFRWLQQVTGDSRDLDVYVLEFDDFRDLVPAAVRDDLRVLHAVLGERRAAAHAAMSGALRSERYRAIVSEWRTLLGVLPGLPSFDRPGAARPIESLAGERIAKVYRRMVKLGRAIDADSPAEAYHELRKTGKELRYLLELFGTPLFCAEVVKPMIKSLKSLQDTLGRHQDREVQQTLLHGLRDEVATRPGGARALLAMGMLVARLGDDERAARAEFAERLDRFAAKDQRRLVREEFS